MSLPIGKVKLTADGAVGISGKNCRVYFVILRATGGGAATVALKEGTGTGGTEMDTIDAAVSSAGRVNYAGGLLFNGGCYADVGSNVSYVTIGYEMEGS